MLKLHYFTASWFPPGVIIISFPQPGAKLGHIHNLKPWPKCMIYAKLL